MYYLHHYVIQWDRVRTVDDLKRILQALQITFDRDCQAVEGIRDLVELVEKPRAQFVMD